MPWWGVLLMVVGAQGLFLLAYWLLTRRNRPDLSQLLGKMGRSAEQRRKDEQEAERKAKEVIKAAYQSLAKERKKLEEWYNANKAKIDEDARRTFEELAGDPDAIDRKLDELLGAATGEEGTPGEG